MTRVSTIRRPSVGMLAPFQSIMVEVELTMTDDETPVVLTRSVSDVQISHRTPASFRLTNLTGRSVIFLAYVAHKRVVKMLLSPWQETVQALTSPSSLRVLQELLVKKLSEVLLNKIK